MSNPTISSSTLLSWPSDANVDLLSPQIAHAQTFSAMSAPCCYLLPAEMGSVSPAARTFSRSACNSEWPIVFVESVKKYIFCWERHLWTQYTLRTPSSGGCPRQMPQESWEISPLAPRKASGLHHYPAISHANDAHLEHPVSGCPLDTITPMTSGECSVQLREQMTTTKMEF